MSRRRLIVLLFVALLAVSLVVAPALAQEEGEGGEGGEGGSGITSIFVFISGAALLVYSAEKLIGYLVESASGLGISAFVLAIIFTGIEFDDIALGVALGLEGLSGVALGIVFGTALSLSGVTLALACIFTPTEVDIPNDYIVLFAVSPLVILPFVFLLGGSTLTTVGSIILIALFVLFVIYVGYRERATNQPVIRNPEVREMMDGGMEPSAAADVPFARERDLPGIATIGLAVLALAGLVIGAATTGMGAEGIIGAYGIEGTVFGATLATAVLTIEDIVLTVEPVRKGAPEIGVGNVIGSIIFSVTGKLGVIGLAGSIALTSGEALTWHFPALVVLTVLAAYFIYTERLRPWQGYLLLGLYIAYWVVSYFLLNFLPAEA
jgi:cation:H+ antiporter